MKPQLPIMPITEQPIMEQLITPLQIMPQRPQEITPPLQITQPPLITQPEKIMQPLNLPMPRVMITPLNPIMPQLKPHPLKLQVRDTGLLVKNWPRPTLDSYPPKFL